jgi:uncharacterized SAM-binding protein YcdF (DUF218 family)
LIIFILFALFFGVFILWRRARAATALTGGALFWLLASGWLAAPLLDWAQSGANEAARIRYAPRTALIVLGNGTRYDDTGTLRPQSDAWDRIAKAAALYADCKRSVPTCRVIVSGGNPQRHAASEADTYAPYLLRLRVRSDDLILENTSRNTYENAANVARILRSQRYDSLILVTSAYHMRRALLDFDRFGLTPQPAVSNLRRARIGLLPRVTNLIDANLALHELIGIAQFHVYRSIGWF